MFLRSIIIVALAVCVFPVHTHKESDSGFFHSLDRIPIDVAGVLSSGFGFAYFFGDAVDPVLKLRAVARALTDMFASDELTAISIDGGLRVVAFGESCALVLAHDTGVWIG